MLMIVAPYTTCNLINSYHGSQLVEALLLSSYNVFRIVLLPLSIIFVSGRCLHSNKAKHVNSHKVKFIDSIFTKLLAVQRVSSVWCGLYA
jgi:hypothetical protein